jgi:hypothetical protein
MSFKDDFGDKMNSRVLIEGYQGNDGYVESFSEGVSMPCFIKEDMVRLPQKDETVIFSMLQIFLDGSVEVESQDRITFGEVQRKILRITRVRDPDTGDPYKIIIFT